MSIFVSFCICLMGLMFYLKIDFFSLSLFVNLVSPFFSPHLSWSQSWPSEDWTFGVSDSPEESFGPCPEPLCAGHCGGKAVCTCAAIVGERPALCVQHSIWRHTAAAFVFSVGPILCFVQKACLTLSREKTSLTSAELREMQEPRSLVSLSRLPEFLI